MQKILAIVGPTATGKTDLGLSLAKQLNGELMACDSRQVYCGLDIGTGKDPGEEYQSKVKAEGWWQIDGIKIWLYDLVSPQQQFTVKDYIEEGHKIFDQLATEGKLPVIVGGTGLYLKGLLEGLPLAEVKQDFKLRQELEKLSLAELQGRLRTLSPTFWTKMNQSDQQNPRRLIRAIEICTMNPYIPTDSDPALRQPNYNVLKIGLTAPRPYLNQRIDLRVDRRIDQGLVVEGEQLQHKGLGLARMRQLGLEYGLLADLLSGKINQQQFQETLKIKSHQYAKRQMVWFKKDPQINWFDISQPGWQAEVVKLVTSWYDKANESQN